MGEQRDMRDEFGDRKRELEKTLTETVLSEEQRRTIVLAMEFGYSAAYCQRTSDMSGIWSASDRYLRGYEQTLAFIRGIK